MSEFSSAIVVSITDTYSYSTASIWYADGAAVDVVKLEGGAAYKQVMRSVNVLSDPSTSSTGSTRGSLGFMSLRDYLPLWTAIEPVDSNAEAITWMLKGLKAATETHVEEFLTAVSISSPFPIGHGSPFENTLRTTAESLGLNYKGTRTAATAITGLYGLEGQCDPDVYKTPDQKEPDDPPKTHLGLDYSRAGISAFLVEEECGVTEVLREFHNTTLAADLEFPEKHEDLTRAMKNMIRPVDDRYSGSVSQRKPVKLSELVMLGESTEDEILHEVLSEVFANNYTAMRARSDERARTHHPLFTGSRAAAMSCQKQLEFELTHQWDEKFQGWLLKDTSGEDQRWWWSRERSM